MGGGWWVVVGVCFYWFPTLPIWTMCVGVGGMAMVWAQLPSDIQLLMHVRLISKTHTRRHPQHTRRRNCSVGCSHLTNTEKEFFEIKPKSRTRGSARCTAPMRSHFNSKTQTQRHGQACRHQNCSEVGRKSDGNGRLPGDVMVGRRRRGGDSPCQSLLHSAQVRTRSFSRHLGCFDLKGSCE